jgi:phosphopantothenoylcysteine decarboxylase/phosphopantothenate--cysteine ligase
MNCIVTAGPAYENLDKVRRLTNFSTGRLGILLANYFAGCGHDVTLLVAEQATYTGERRAQRIETFTTSASLQEWLRVMASPSVHAVFHAAAVSDFTFGKIWLRSPHGDLTEIKARKISTRQGTLLAELVPTPKVLGELRDWYPKARIVGWKYEVDGDRDAAIAAAEKQVKESLTDACVANGEAYGEGFGLVTSNGKCAHQPDAAALFEALARFTRP